jgi:hypothetical protein
MARVGLSALAAALAVASAAAAAPNFKLYSSYGPGAGTPADYLVVTQATATTSVAGVTAIKALTNARNVTLQVAGYPILVNSKYLGFADVFEVTQGA